MEELKVFRGDTFAAMLRRTLTGCELELDSAFIANRRYAHFTYKIAKQKSIYKFHGVNLPPFFAGLLPEGLRLKRLISELKTSEDDLFTLLVAVGESCVGDISTHISDEKKKDRLEIPKWNQVDFYDLFEKSLMLDQISASNESLAGIQEKISASMVSLPLSSAKASKSYILKLNPKDKPNLVYNEYHCLMLAKKCGLRVNSAKIVYDKNENPGLLVERFDRIADDNNDFNRVHQEDACQFLDRYPADKYRLSFQEICLGIQELATASTLEILKAIELYVFCYLIGNGDLHAKNISLQTDYRTGRIQLTPAYDIICTYLYKDKKMALKLDGRDENIKRRNFIDFAIRFGITEKSINNKIDRILIDFKKHLPLLFDIPLMSSKEKTMVENMTKKRIRDLS